MGKSRIWVNGHEAYGFDEDGWLLEIGVAIQSHDTGVAVIDVCTLEYGGPQPQECLNTRLRPGSDGHNTVKAKD